MPEAGEILDGAAGVVLAPLNYFDFFAPDKPVTQPSAVPTSPPPAKSSLLYDVLAAPLNIPLAVGSTVVAGATAAGDWVSNLFAVGTVITVAVLATIAYLAYQFAKTTAGNAGTAAKIAARAAGA